MSPHPRMSPDHGRSSRRGRRAAGLAGLLTAAELLVIAKAATAPARIVVSAPTTTPATIPPATIPPARTAPTRSTTPAGTARARSTAPSPVPRTRATSAPPTPATVTVLGSPEDVGYGTVQVRITVSRGRITDVEAVRMPSGGHSSQVAAYAAPQLRSEVLAAQSAQIDSVSGASYDSEGYARSVQSALDAVPR